MIKITYRQLNSGQFTQALGKLARCSELPMKAAYSVGKIQEKAHKELEAAQKMFQTRLIDRFSEKDEQGKNKETEGHPGSYAIPDAVKPEFEKAFDELMEIVIEIPYNAIEMSVLERAMEKAKSDKLSAQELVALEPVLINDLDGPVQQSGPRIVKI